MKKGCMIGLGVVGILILVMVMIGGWVFSYYNQMVSGKETVTSKWAQVENQLQRRADLIPNLVNATKGYMKHESQIFIQIAEARAKLAGAQTIDEKIKAHTMIEGALSRLLVIVERYPDLKANQSFARLMDELAGTENRISVERKRYNETVKEYNTLIKKIPGMFFAKIFGFKESPYFEIEEKAKAVPKVEF
ncbi:MAG: LemA family protein [bacterium]|nr:LemA family protein [bacterium]